MTQLFADFREDNEEQAELNAKLNQKEEVKEPNYEKVIDEAFAFARFSEDPVEQNRLNFELAKSNLYKALANNQKVSEADYNVLKENNYPVDSAINDGNTAAPGVDLSLLALPFLAKPALLAGGLKAGINLIKRYPLKSVEVGLTGLGAASSGDSPEDIVFETLGMKTDTMFTGGRGGGFNKYTALGIKKLGEIFTDIFDGPNPKFATEGGKGLENTFLMSKSDDATGGIKDFSKVTSPEYENIILSGMERMGMKDGIFNLDLYNQNSNILAEMSDTLGGTMTKSGIRRINKLGKRNWMEYFLSPESLKGNFKALRKEGKIAADIEWEDFLKSKGLTIQDIQSHHINPLYDSIHLFDGVKWGSDEYWEIISTLINMNARTGVIQRGTDVTNVIRTLGKSTLTDTPHGIAHAYYKDIVPTFFSKSERDLMKLDPGYRLQKTKEWARIVNQSEDIVVKAHKAWTALNPKSRMPFDELIEEMAAYDNMGILKGVSIKYQVKDIQELVKQINFEAIIEPLPNIKFPNVSETKQRMLLYKAQPGVTWKMVKKKFPGFNYEQLDLFE